MREWFGVILLMLLFGAMLCVGLFACSRQVVYRTKYVVPECPPIATPTPINCWCPDPSTWVDKNCETAYSACRERLEYLEMDRCP